MNPFLSKGIFLNLRTALDGLDSTPGNVTFTDTLTGDPVGGAVRYHTQIVKRLNGTADFDVGFDLFGGRVDLAGLMGISAEVVVDLTFGFDAQGFFVDTTGSTRELAIRDVQVVGDASASGHFGFLDVNVGVDVDVDGSLAYTKTSRDPTSGQRAFSCQKRNQGVLQLARGGRILHLLHCPEDGAPFPVLLDRHAAFHADAYPLHRLVSDSHQELLQERHFILPVATGTCTGPLATIYEKRVGLVR